MDKKKEIFISFDAQESRVAVTENGRLDEYYVERASDNRMVGSVYKGRVASVVPGINAAFVDIGLGKNGFLYVSDIIPQAEGDEDFDENGGEEPEDRPRRNNGNRRSKIEDVVKVDQEILVQVVKEPFGTKGARLTTHISLPGRYMVLMANDARLGISKRIEDSKERTRLREILNKLQFSKEAGLIIRTAGVGKDEKDFERDVRYLSRLHQRIKRAVATAKAPACIHQEYKLSQRVIRDSFTEDINRIVVDSKTEYLELKKFLDMLLPGVTVQVELYKGDEPLFEHVGLNEQIDALFDQKVQLPSGGEIVIEQTEGMVAIDVNTARFTGKKNLEETAFQVNKEAAVEIARQLHLRDVGGIVIIDFIDLDMPSHRKELVRILERALSKDRAKTNLVSFSEICVAELTRQRMRRSVLTVSRQECPYCKGRGTIKSSLTVAIESIRAARHGLANTKNKTLELLVHPSVAMRLLQENRESLRIIENKNRAKILVLSDPSLHVEEIKAQVID
jgi:ribonuclease G